MGRSVKALVIALTPAERDLLVSVLHLAEEFEADTEATRPLIELLEKAMTAKEARHAAVGVVA
jgi:hypothetical protein